MYYKDEEHDGFGLTNDTMCSSSPVLPYVTEKDGDCDDSDREVNPRASEPCDGKDNDCTGIADEEGSPGCTIFYKDCDQDRYGKDSDKKACAIQ